MKDRIIMGIIRSGILIALSLPSFSQVAPENDAVMIPIRQLFKGMNSGDSAMVHGAFVIGKEVTLATVLTDKNGHPLLRRESLDPFLKAVGTPHAETWSEPIWDWFVQLDGNFAQVWAKYAFFLGKKFNHCGVDTFHLFKGTDGQWKIFHLADTRQLEGCVVPTSIRNQFNP